MVLLHQIPPHVMEGSWLAMVRFSSEGDEVLPDYGMAWVLAWYDDDFYHILSKLS